MHTSSALLQPELDLPRQAANPSPLPRRLRDFRNYHAGKTILVCGCGSSLSEVVSPERSIIIGVNDVGRLLQPDYLVVLNPRQQFTAERFRYVEQSRATAIFTQLELGISHPHIVRFKLGRFAGSGPGDPDALDYSRNSPYLAVCLAAHMGATRIGLIGVDFTDHHFFGATGRHALMADIPRIDREYTNLYNSCRAQGIELLNLSSQSRLTALPKISPAEFSRVAVLPPRDFPQKKLFFVNYKFLSCGDVFRHGLAHAAADLKLDYSEAYWDDSDLTAKVRQFDPDLLFVVHGRRFAQRWQNRFAGISSAVWLLDEPYEVDDTAGFSTRFQTVFLNDPSTLHRHRNARYLPACYDPANYTCRPAQPRKYNTGFIGGYNGFREQLMGELASRRLLSYVVGGPWRTAAVQGLNLSGNVPAEQTGELYRNTKIVLNIFRTEHHFNRTGLPAASLNPRVYEALACGALVISEYREEINLVCPELPVFHNSQELPGLVERFLGDSELFERTRRACIRRLAQQTYAERLITVLRACFPQPEVIMTTAGHTTITPDPPPSIETASEILPPGLSAHWELDKTWAQFAEGDLLLKKTYDERPGSEQGVIGRSSVGNASLEFDVYLEAGTVFLAKIHQVEANNQLANSYHIVCRGSHGYLARHGHIFSQFSLPLNTWIHLSFSYSDGAISLRNNSTRLAYAQDRALPAGYCFLGVKGGSARLRNIRINALGLPRIPTAPIDYEQIYSEPQQGIRQVTIVTTVYDRVDCLRRCLQSVRELSLVDYEHIIVADSPPPSVLKSLKALIAESQPGNSKTILATLKQRRNDWGISPACAGLSMARGRYISFLSDDNGYMPNHFEKLVRVLDSDPNIGFAYSSCRYAGRAILRPPVPRPGGIDLGQPLFRRELFHDYLGGTIPFHEFGWDWRMIDAFLKNGVKCRHVDDATFIFRLASYPHLISKPTTMQLSQRR
jgi:hypothetical protein